MKNLSIQFYLEITTTRTHHRMYARIACSGKRKKIYSEFLIPEACWIKKQNRTIARSNKKEFADQPRFFSKTSQANAWIEMLEVKVSETNDRITKGEEFTFDQIMDFFTGKTNDVVVPIESELTLKEFFDKSLENHIYLRKISGKDLATTTINNYSWYKEKYARLLGENFLMKDFDQKKLDEFTYKLIDGGTMLNTSIKSFYSALKAIMAKGEMLQIMPASYKFPKFPQIKESEHKLKVRLSIGQIEKLKTLECHDNIQKQAVAGFLIAFYGCGMRMSEVLLLRMKHINPQMKIFNYYSQKTNETVPHYQMSNDFWKTVETYYDANLNPETFVMPIMRAYSKMKIRNGSDNALVRKIKCVEKQFNDRYKKVSAQLMFPEEFSGHSPRKSFALALYEATGDVMKVKELLNHKKIDTTMIYLTKNGVKSIMSKSDNIDIFEAFKELAKKETPEQKLRKIG